MRAFSVILMVFAMALVGLVYAYIVNPELLMQVGRDKLLSPPAIFTAIIFIFFSLNLLWVKFRSPCKTDRGQS